MKTLKSLLKLVAVCFFVTAVTQCAEEKENECYVRPQTAEESTHPNDVYLKENMLIPYGTAVRWRWDNRFIDPNEEATPIKAEYVIPVTKLIKYFWIDVFESQGEAGKKIIETLFPPEIQYIGSYIYLKGAVKLGYAEGGARITLLNLNNYDLTNKDWLTSAKGGVLNTIHHEFAHLFHQNYGFPDGFVGLTDYKGNGWKSLNPKEGKPFSESLALGCVSDYATNGESDDFADLVAHFLIMPPTEFESKYLALEDCSKSTDATACQKTNEGREKIKVKLDLVIKYYKDKFNLDLVSMRDEMQKRLDYVLDRGDYPEGGVVPEFYLPNKVDEKAVEAISFFNVATKYSDKFQEDYLAQLKEDFKEFGGFTEVQMYKNYGVPENPLNCICVRSGDGWSNLNYILEKTNRADVIKFKYDKPKGMSGGYIYFDKKPGIKKFIRFWVAKDQEFFIKRTNGDKYILYDKDKPEYWVEFKKENP